MSEKRREDYVTFGLTEDFKKSSYTTIGGNPACVEVALRKNTVLVRDTKNREEGTLNFTLREWSCFIKGVKDGEFNL